MWLDQHQLQIKKIKSEMLLGNGHGVKKKRLIMTPMSHQLTVKSGIIKCDDWFMLVLNHTEG